jgi:hypothetical protein
MAQQGRVAKRTLKGGLTPKQAKYVQGIAEGKPGYKAAMDAYETDSLNVANTISVENMQKPTVREAVLKALDGHSLSADDAVAPVKRALQYQGETERESLEMNLKGADRLMKLMSMTENKGEVPGGIHFHQHTGNQKEGYDIG